MRDASTAHARPSLRALIASDCEKRREFEHERPGIRLRWFADPGFRAGLAIRVATAAHRRGHVGVARALAATAYLRYRIRFDPATSVGPRLLLRRAMGVALVGAPTLGSDIVITDMVSIGEHSHGAPDRPTTIGDGVVIEHGSYVAAGSAVGDGCVIGPVAIVDGDVPSRHRVVGRDVSPLTDRGTSAARDRDGEPDVTAPRLRDTVAMIASDFERRSVDAGKSLVRTVLETPLSPAALATLSYRISHHCWHHHGRGVAHLLRAASVRYLGADLHPAARIGPALYLSHSIAASVGPGVRMGSSVFLCPHASVDRAGTDEDGPAVYPRIGDDVFLGVRSCVVGAASVGTGCLVGSTTAVVGESFGQDLLVVGAPASAKPLSSRLGDVNAWDPGPDRPFAETLRSAGETRTLRQYQALRKADVDRRRGSRPLLEQEPTPGEWCFTGVAQRIVRLQNLLHARGHPVLARALFMVNHTVFALDIPQGSWVGPGFRLSGCYGICVRSGLTVGPNVTWHEKVTVGDNLGRVGLPLLHDGVTLKQGASVSGPVDVGAGAIVGPNVMLMHDVPPNTYTDGVRSWPLDSPEPLANASSRMSVALAK